MFIILVLLNFTPLKTLKNLSIDSLELNLKAVRVEIIMYLTVIYKVNNRLDNYTATHNIELNFIYHLYLIFIIIIIIFIIIIFIIFITKNKVK